MPGCKPGDKAVIIGPAPNDPDYCEFLADNIGTFVSVDSSYPSHPQLLEIGAIPSGPLFKCSSKHPIGVHVPVYIDFKVQFLHRKQHGDIIPDKWLQPIRPLGQADEMNTREAQSKSAPNFTDFTNEEFKIFADEFRKVLTGK